MIPKKIPQPIVLYNVVLPLLFDGMMNIILGFVFIVYIEAVVIKYTLAEDEGWKQVYKKVSCNKFLYNCNRILGSRCFQTGSSLLFRTHKNHFI